MPLVIKNEDSGEERATVLEKSQLFKPELGCSSIHDVKLHDEDRTFWDLMAPLDKLNKSHQNLLTNLMFCHLVKHTSNTTVNYG